MNTVSDKPKPIQEITDVGLLTGGGSCIGESIYGYKNKGTKQ